MPNISITDFADFVLRTGPPKITKVAEVFKRGDYKPSHDFWKPLRDNICEFHEGKSANISFSATGAHEKKQLRYEEAVKGYKKYLSTAKPVWFKAHKAEWKHEDLTVRINPEVGFILGETSYLVKLYFKQEPLTASRVQIILGLMASGQANDSYKLAILDVVRSKLHIQGVSTPQMEALLRGEASTFLSIWHSLEAEV